MKTFHVYLTFYGKKLRISVEATNKLSAMEKVKNSISFDKIVEAEDLTLDSLRDMFGMK
jgi:hypothetical protein